ncbi:MAG: ACT domain-containing protein [Clostridiales bacterium]|nr:ACT domain-containing protein [Clostridiales bacterium]
MFIKQLSIFIENRPGRINEVTKALAENDINIVCVSLSDTVDYGVFRLIVSNPKTAQEILTSKGFSSTLTDVVGVKLPPHFGMLNKLTDALSDSGISLSYIYALNSGKDDAAVIIKTSDNKKAVDAIKAAGLEILNPSAAYNL